MSEPDIIRRVRLTVELAKLKLEILRSLWFLKHRVLAQEAKVAQLEAELAGLEDTWRAVEEKRKRDAERPCREPCPTCELPCEADHKDPYPDVHECPYHLWSITLKRPKALGGGEKYPTT